MCGIAGLWAFRESADARDVAAMADAVRHRGPDGEGIARFDTTRGEEASPDGRADLVLGHRRLAILDLSDRALQPMKGWGRWVVYNGELYNYLELRAELVELGYRFTTESDTEVLLAGYDAWGAAALSRFNGMWAFVVYDPKARELFCARDRMGVKPFYYWHDGARFAFASEIKSLRRAPGVRSTPNAGIIAEYLALGLTDHTDETFYQGVLRLPAGHWARVRVGAPVVPTRYWSLPSDGVATDISSASSALEAVLEDAVRVRLRSDVAVGTCLSGGLDSSSVASLVSDLLRAQDPAARGVGERQRTFTARFDDRRFDESAHARRIIELTGASAHFVVPDGARLWDEFAAVQRHQDEPVQSSSVYAQYNVFRLVRETGVVVTLDGQGADEIFAGYPAYQGIALADALVSGRARDAADQFVGAMRVGGRGRDVISLAGRAALGLLPTRARTVVRRMRDRRLRAHLSSQLYREARGRLEAREHELGALQGSLRARLAADLTKYSLPALLRYADRSSMAFGVESRMPFLDVRLVEMAARLPSHLLVRSGWSKWILRHAMARRLPQETVWRRDKMGFVTPEVSWLRADALRNWLAQPIRSIEYQRIDALRGGLDAHLAREPDGAYYSRIWRNVNLELWFRWNL